MTDTELIEQSFQIAWSVLERTGELREPNWSANFLLDEIIRRSWGWGGLRAVPTDWSEAGMPSDRAALFSSASAERAGRCAVKRSWIGSIFISSARDTPLAECREVERCGDES
jgi:hypothetical protein